jgi:hypothetical protein
MLPALSAQPPKMLIGAFQKRGFLKYQTNTCFQVLKVQEITKITRFAYKVRRLRLCTKVYLVRFGLSFHLPGAPWSNLPLNLALPRDELVELSFIMQSYLYEKQHRLFKALTKASVLMRKLSDTRRLLCQKVSRPQSLVLNGHPYLSGAWLGVDLRTDTKKT